MTELIEGYSPPTLEKKPDDPKDKKPLTIRIHLLCDGTNNNRANIAEREKSELGGNSESYKKFGNGKDTSYDNGRTNIANMEPHVEFGKGLNGYSVVVKVYVQGQGTLQFNKDDDMGLGMAAFSTGVSERARAGITEALNNVYEELLKDKPPELFFIKQVDVDVFGFSRGAATARHAIHLMTETEIKVISDHSGYGTQTIVTNQPLYERLQTTYGYREMRADQVKIIFAGLYDTVVSVNASQLAPAWIANNTRDQKAVAKAKFALHLAAADEHRQDFPLHKIKSSLDAGKGAEYYFPGAHSDIGGSYNLANEKLLDDKTKNAEIRQLEGSGSISDLKAQKAVLEDQGHKVEIVETAWSTGRGGRGTTEGMLYTYRKIKGFEHVRRSDEYKVINRGSISDLEIDKANLIKDGWYHDWQLHVETNVVATLARAPAQTAMNALAVLTGFPMDGRSVISGKLFASRRGITSGYCNIPLKFMVEHSRKHSILIKDKLDQRIKIILEEEPKNNFNLLENTLRAYMAYCGLTGSKPSHWTDMTLAKQFYPGIKKLRNRHLHMSCRFDGSGVIGKLLKPVADLGFTPRFENNLRRRFYYEG